MGFISSGVEDVGGLIATAILSARAQRSISTDGRTVAEHSGLERRRLRHIF